MPIKYITKWNTSKINQIIDVRSPSEFKEDHIPGSINLPVLNDKERKLVGTIYKNESPFKAKKIGASLISKNISIYINNKFINNPGSWKPLIYCWRGGQRSKSIAITLSEIGWEIFVLRGGYKTYRKTLNNSLNKVVNNYKFIVLRGKTGTAKTIIIKNLKLKGAAAIDLENIAKHKGSLLGKHPKIKQPTQKFFESLLFYEFYNLKKNKPIFIESESSKIGNLFLPSALISKIENSSCIDIETTVEARSSFLIKDYSKFILDKNSFDELFTYARTKLGRKVVNEWKVQHKKENWRELAIKLIKEYYDPLYSHKKNQKKNKVLEIIKLSNLNKPSINKLCKYLITKYL